MQSWTLKVCVNLARLALKPLKSSVFPENSREISANSANVSDVPPAKMLKGWTHKSDFEFKKAWEDEFLKMQAKFNFAYNFQYFSAGIFYELACSLQWTFQNSECPNSGSQAKGVREVEKRVRYLTHQWEGTSFTEAKRPKRKGHVSWKIQIF